MIEIRITSEIPKCDFCSERPVTARYHAESFEIESVSTPQVGQGSEGDWAACTECAKLLDANAWEALVTRARKFFFRNHPEVQGLIPCREFEEHLWSMYRQLREHGFRKGAS